MNIFKHELRIYFKSTLIWIISLVVLVILFSGIYPVMKDGSEVMAQVISKFPEGFQKALGINIVDFSEPLGFYSFIFMYIILTGSLQAMNLGLSILSNELRDKTADFLLAKPIKRIKIVNAKFLAAILILLITNIFFAIASQISLNLMAGYSYSNKALIYILFSLFLIQIFFLTLGMLISVFLDKIKTIVPISMGVVFGFFILNMLNQSLEGEPLTAFTPFAYFSASSIYENIGYDMKWFVLNLVLVIIFTVGAYIKYIKKDIPSV